MGINIGEFDHPKMGRINIEISNDKEFLRRIKQINREAAKKGIEDAMKLWKIRQVGEGRVAAEIQRTKEKAEAPAETIVPSAEPEKIDTRPRRPRPGGALA